MEDFSKYLKYEGQTRMRNRDTEITGTVKLYSFKVKALNQDSTYILPKWLKLYVTNALYALTDRALATIKFLFSEAVKFDKCTYFNGYDTMIRDELFGISNEFVNKAIYLLTDYYFDPSNEYYISSNNTLIGRNVLKKLILYDLWAGRTGRGLQKNFAGILAYDSYYTGQSYYQNDFWLKRVLDNEELIQESSFIVNNIPHYDEAIVDIDTTVIGDVSCTRYDMLFMFYQKEPQKTTHLSEFENNFTNDIPERQIWKYKILHYNDAAALRLGLNTIFYDVFGEEPSLMLNAIYDFKYKIELIKPNTGKYEPTINLLKKGF